MYINIYIYIFERTKQVSWLLEYIYTCTNTHRKPFCSPTNVFSWSSPHKDLSWKKLYPSCWWKKSQVSVDIEKIRGFNGISELYSFKRPSCPLKTIQWLEDVFSYWNSPFIFSRLSISNFQDPVTYPNVQSQPSLPNAKHPSIPRWKARLKELGWMKQQATNVASELENGGFFWLRMNLRSGSDSDHILIHQPPFFVYVLLLQHFRTSNLLPCSINIFDTTWFQAKPLNSVPDSRRAST